METVKIIKIALVALIGLISLWLAGSVWESVDANEICVIQAMGSGKRTVHVTAGWKFQWFGTVRKYNKSFQYWFSKPNENSNEDRAIPVQYNDGGHARISGSCRIDLPLDQASILVLDEKFKEQRAIETQLIRPTIEKAVYFVGPLMSSRESFSEKKNDLIFYIEDQATHGVYKTVQKEVRVKDLLSGADKTTIVVDIVKDASTNLPVRNEQSPITAYNLKMSGLSINAVDYDSTVLQQIATQQQAIMSIQLAVTRAKEAEQNTITTEQEGKATAAKAKWTQEAEKATEVTRAEQERDVAKLAKETAEFTKQTDILLGQGEAERKRLVFNADGALELKTNAWLKAQEIYAREFGKQKWVPEIMIGGSGNTAPGMSVEQFMNMLSIRTAKDLALDINQIKK